MSQNTQAALPDDPQPYPGWPGPCAHFGCETPHPCPLFHDPTACDEAPRDGCGCDLEALLTGELDVGQDVDDEDLDPEPEWCPNPQCYDRVHGDGMHTDEDGRPFHGSTPEPVYEPELPVYDEDDLIDDEPAAGHLEVDDRSTPPAPKPWTFEPHPIYDQLVAEQTYPEMTTP